MVHDKDRWRALLRMDALLMVVAVVAGVTGIWLSSRFLQAKAAATEAGLRTRYEARAVVVAAADLPQGETLDAARLAVRNMPREFLPEDAVPAERAAELIGGRTAIAIRRGTPVVSAALRADDQVQRLSAVLGEEQRALTIAVDEVNSQAGNLLPGDRVDLLYSRSDGGEAVLVPLLQHVEVLATGAALLGENLVEGAASGRGFGTITLRLSPDDAARVVLAQQSGSLSVVLRSSADSKEISSDLRNSRNLLRKPAQKRSAGGESRVELLVGGNGGLSPDQSWLSIGHGSTAVAGDAS